MDFQQHLQEEIDKDFDLLKKYEDRWRGESDPGRKYRLDQDIEEIKNRILERQKELQSFSSATQENNLNIDILVQEVRKHHYDKIQHLCGTLRILDVPYPIDTADFIVQVNVLDRPNSFVRIDLNNLPDLINTQTNELERLLLGKVKQERLSGIDVAKEHSKLMILGKPGSGKSTFLQHLAILCNQREFCSDKVPIFIRLKDFADQELRNGEFDLSSFIHREFSEYEIPEQFLINKLLNTGRLLFLFDGLDEVDERYTNRVVDGIRKFSEKYYKNNYVITCRNATQQHQLRFFTDVEIADFDRDQIISFVRKWFLIVEKRPESEATLIASQFIKKLEQPENSPIRELVGTPILLILACLVFSSYLEFPSNRISLYKEGLDILLKKWDEVRGIDRNQMYKGLSLEQKLNLLIYIASITFEQKSYFFSQDKICQYIANYVPILPNSESNRLLSRDDSVSILKSIEVQHGLLIERSKGIYSFSHLTFQEYLTTQKFIDAILVNEDVVSLEKLFSHSTEVNWKEVFSLFREAIEDSANLTRFIQIINKFIADEDEIQKLLAEIEKKSNLIETTHNSLLIRSFYFSLSLGFYKSFYGQHDFGIIRFLNSDFMNLIITDLSLCKAYKKNLKSQLNLSLILDLALVRAQKGLCDILFTIDFNSYLHSELIRDLRNLWDYRQEIEEYRRTFRCPKNDPINEISYEAKANMDKNLKNMDEKWIQKFIRWWQKLETYHPQHSNIYREINLSSQQQEKLKKYYDMNLFLFQTLGSTIDIQGIENTILMPRLDFNG